MLIYQSDHFNLPCSLFFLRWSWVCGWLHPHLVLCHHQYQSSLPHNQQVYTKKSHTILNIILIISSVNVFIYCTVGKQFKDILKKSLRRKIMRTSDDCGSVSDGEKTEGIEISRTMTPTIITTYLQLPLN